MTTLRTDRLTLRPFREADIPAYSAIRRKPGVTRYLPSHTDDPAESDHRAADVVRSFAALWQNPDPGYGPWAVLSGDRLIGHGGLRRVEEEGVTEVLYALDPDFHGQGLATELGRAALDHGFGPLGLDRIVAWAMPANAASLAVMQRLGMTRKPGLVAVFGVQAIEYSIDRLRHADGNRAKGL